MTPPRLPMRTHEEIAERLYSRLLGPRLLGVGASEALDMILAALREAADAALREEREALRERLAGDVEHWKSESQKGPIPWSSNCDGSAHEARNLLAWLDAALAAWDARDK